MNTNQNQHRAITTTRKLLATLGAAATLAAAALPVAARADAAPTGANAPRQERNPSASPKLFTATPVTTAPAPRDGRAKRAKDQGRSVALLANTVVVAAPATTGNGGNAPFGDLTGANAPRQERNPSAHPELWVQDAGR